MLNLNWKNYEKEYMDNNFETLFGQEYKYLLRTIHQRVKIR